MPKIKFLPKNEVVNVPAGLKVLVAAIKNNIKIRYGCAACQCGTCGIKIIGGKSGLEPMKADEENLLKKMGLDLDGSKRLACRAKVLKDTIEVDLDFQNQYDTTFRK